VTYWIVIACTAVAELYLLRRLRFDWVIVATVLLGTLVSANYWAYTSIYVRSYDGPSHVLYIDEIAEHHRLPSVSVFCTACGHPPLYYALAALWSKVVLAGGWIPREMGLQWLSLLLFFGFVVSSLLLLRSTIERPATLRLAAAMVVFWPSSVLNSVRVHNDSLASTLIIAAMYFISQWDRRGRHRDFYLAVTASVLALFTKSTGYTIAVTLLAVAALRLRSKRFTRESVVQCAAATLVLSGAALLAVAFRESTHPLSLCQRVLGNACDLPREVFGSNQPINYYYFDLWDFVSQKSSLADPLRQDYFLNGLAKSSLFGTLPLGKDFEGETYKRLAALIRLLLLAIVGVCAVVVPFIGSARWRRYRAIIGAAASMLILLAAFRFLVPSPFHEDFRHIFPVLVPLCLLYAKVVERLSHWSDALYKIGVAIGLLMVTSSVAFFVRVL
jgi:hypothetical protein